jgi:hypothetical protein
VVVRAFFSKLTAAHAPLGREARASASL